MRRHGQQQQEMATPRLLSESTETSKGGSAAIPGGSGGDPPPTEADGHVHSDSNSNASSSSSSSSSSPASLRLFALAGAFFLAMVVHEVALEAASTSFSHLDALTSAVTLFQFGSCVALPAIVEGPRHVLKTFPRTLSGVAPYVRLSLAVFGATALATKSLVYVSFPTKVVFKSAKLIPTMIVSTIVNPGAPTSQFSVLDYLAAALLCAGAAGYSYGSGSSDGKGASSSSVGIALLTASVVCDAVVPNMQQKLMAPPHAGLPTTEGGGGADGGGGLGLTAAELMVNVNAVGFSGLLLYMLLTGSLLSAVRASLADPTLLAYLTAVGLGLSTAVLAYTRLIKYSGSVVAVAVATLRKVATVVLSYVIFPKPLLRVHVLSGLLVLAGVFLNTYARQRSRRRGSSSSSSSSK